MKKILLLFIVIFAISCKAQDVYPLKTLYTELPNYVYLKDTNNELSGFTGTYTANYEGKSITLFITKHNKKLLDRINLFYKDILIVNYLIKDYNGNILIDSRSITFNSNLTKDFIISHWVDDNGQKLFATYGGTNCGVGNGIVNLTKLNATQLSWEYVSGVTILTDKTCPPGTDIKVYLPKTKDLIFTKAFDFGEVRTK
ncbi:hypothetical protein SAMN05660477_00101 [Soonwooa buanensis]|uniref:DUF6705 domain-containing protein n=1 Tax=Soonwooa buanensis TaxID=619805 RepID=A0A1T5CJ38_9FLAO|nr:DUF6705 family protein [Soonwooa buanensis]SKB59482.1 hypothetical protein SAMN05660477_00101 [Soonwooa buanensis]